MKVKFEIEMPDSSYQDFNNKFTGEPFDLGDIFKGRKAVISRLSRSLDNIYGGGAMPLGVKTKDAEVDLQVIE